MIWIITNDLPEDFGDREILAITSDPKLKEHILDYYKGVTTDSYAMQYVKVQRKKMSIEEINA